MDDMDMRSGMGGRMDDLDMRSGMGGGPDMDSFFAMKKMKDNLERMMDSMMDRYGFYCFQRTSIKYSRDLFPQIYTFLFV